MKIKTYTIKANEITVYGDEEGEDYTIAMKAEEHKPDSLYVFVSDEETEFLMGKFVPIEAVKKALINLLRSTK